MKDDFIFTIVIGGLTTHLYFLLYDVCIVLFDYQIQLKGPLKLCNEMNKTKYFFWGALIGGLSIFSTNLDAQNNASLEKIKSANKKPAIELMKDQLSKQKEIKHKQLKQWSGKGYPLSNINEEGSFQVVGFDSNNNPVYYKTTNQVAGQSIRVDQLHNNANFDGGVQGEGMTVGVWDGGRTYINHKEFQGRVSEYETIPSAYSDHATHVTGTIAAGGVRPNAIGMAPKSNVVTHDWDDDILEMTEAAENGLLLSNHSYGLVSGYDNAAYSGNIGWHWFGNISISDQEDYRFGYYDEKSRTIDELAFNAPYYLMVKAAGNDRDQGPELGEDCYIMKNGAWVKSSAVAHTDGPFDLIESFGNAKNLLTVGAVEDVNWLEGVHGDVEMSVFSNWGPTDDGRIKPEVVANGCDVFSTILLNKYAVQSGTSMAAPSVTGGLILLQEYYHKLNDHYMKSSTLKALAIQSCEEAGSHPGPDYSYGFGLLNTLTAAEIIKEDQLENGVAIIQENSINNGTSLQFDLIPNSTDVLITIVWTDVPGEVHEPALDDPTLKLVNDLDMRLIDEDVTYFPYILDPAQPEAPAQKGDNFRDNVEQIRVSGLKVGRPIVLSITHKGELEGGVQDFSLVVSGADVKEIATSVNDSSLNNNDIKLYPNPTTDRFTISSTSAIQEVSLIDIYGTQHIYQLVDHNDVTLDITALKSGLYFARCKTREGEVKTIKVLKTGN